RACFVGSVADRYKRLQRKTLQITGIASRGQRDEPMVQFGVFYLCSSNPDGSKRRPGAICQARSQSFKRCRKRLVAWILHLSATDPPNYGTRGQTHYRTTTFQTGSKEPQPRS